MDAHFRARSLAALLLTAVLGSPGQEPAVLTLDDAVAAALRSNRMIRNAGIETKKLDDQMAALRTRRLPAFNISALGAQKLTSLDFVFDRGSLGVLPGVGPVPATDTTIHSPLNMTGLLMGQVGQPLSQLHKINLNLQQLRLSSEYSREQERGQRQSVVNNVRRVYYGILQAQSALEAVEESLRLYRELDRVTAEYVAQQVALKSQQLEVKARLAKAEYDALSLRNPLATQKEQLNSLMGRDIRTEFRVAPQAASDWREGDLEAARKSALAQRPEIREARVKSRQADQDRRIKKADAIPDVSLQFQYFSPLNYGKLIPSKVATVGVQLQWEPFDWGRKKFELAQKDRTADQATLAVQEAENQILIDVGNHHRKLAESRMLMDVATASREAAQESLRVVTNRYKEQSSLLKDVLQAQVAVAEANNQYQQALLQFWTAKADFEKSLGEDP